MKGDIPTNEADLVALSAAVLLLKLEVEDGAAAVGGGQLLAELVERVHGGHARLGGVLDDDLRVVRAERVDDVPVLARQLEVVERGHAVARGLHAGCL